MYDTKPESCHHQSLCSDYILQLCPKVLQRVSEIEPCFLPPTPHLPTGLPGNLTLVTRPELTELHLTVPVSLSGMVAMVTSHSPHLYELNGYKHVEPKDATECYLSLKDFEPHDPMCSESGALQSLKTTVSRGKEHANHDSVIHSTGDGCTAHIIPGRIIDLLRVRLKDAVGFCEQNRIIPYKSINVSLLCLESPNVMLLVKHGARYQRIWLVPFVKEIVREWLPKEWPGQIITERDPRIEKNLQTLMLNLKAQTFYHWSVCLSQAVQVVLEAQRQGGHLLDALTILDSVNKIHWQRWNGMPILKIYHLQTALLWAMAFFPSLEDWADLESSVYRLVVILLRAANLQTLPDFFLPGVNAFTAGSTSPLQEEDMRRLYGLLQNFATTPEQFLIIHTSQIPPRVKEHLCAPLRRLLHLPEVTRDGHTLWKQAYFDLLLREVWATSYLLCSHREWDVEGQGEDSVEITDSLSVCLCPTLPSFKFCSLSPLPIPIPTLIILPLTLSHPSFPSSMYSSVMSFLDPPPVCETDPHCILDLP
uniref:Mab-21-like HhH/H2TH-like domain-containing protein n=1 Tax=Eptatretus burgeri TaxID=7764 RepID=A0A8C4N8B8_EPTBU